MSRWNYLNYIIMNIISLVVCCIYWLIILLLFIVFFWNPTLIYKVISFLDNSKDKSRMLSNFNLFMQQLHTNFSKKYNMINNWVTLTYFEVIKFANQIYFIVNTCIKIKIVFSFIMLITVYFVNVDRIHIRLF